MRRSAWVQMGIAAVAAFAWLGETQAQSSAAPAGSVEAPLPYREPWRPQYHFSQPSLFMNDPNGLVHHDGEWHLFYQYRPGGGVVWGHAVSRDLLHWENLTVAIPRQRDGKSIFSGSAVVDHQNTSGFGVAGAAPLVAVYTAAGRNSQAQALAFSLDRGRTFQFYGGNPVLDIGSGQFRDPKVFWHNATSRWVMIVALPDDHQMAIYGSPDLKRWTLLSKTTPVPPTGGQYEVPDLFPLAVDGDPRKTKWVLLISTNPGGKWGGSQTAAYIGDFDGAVFTPDPRYSYDGPPRSAVLGDFEGPRYHPWKATGSAFGHRPLRLGRGETGLSGVRGRGAASSLEAEGVGTLRSPTFKIARKYINFRLTGKETARQPAPQNEGVQSAAKQHVAVRLIVDGVVVRSATPVGGRTFDWVSWSVADLRGRTAHIEVVDENPVKEAGLAVDDIASSDVAALAGTERAPWMDWGKDNYAAITFDNAPDGRRLLIGWLDNWQYAQSQKVPTTAWWRGVQSEPRELSLRTVVGRPELFQEPLRELATLREPGASSLGSRALTGALALPLRGPSLDIEATIEAHEAKRFGVKVFVGSNGDETVVGYDVERQEVYIDRTRSGAAGAAIDGFPGVHSAPLKLKNGQLQLRILVDASVVEVFANNGQRVLTDRVYPSLGSDQVVLFADGGAARLQSATVHRMKSIWVDQRPSMAPSKGSDTQRPQSRAAGAAGA